MSITDELLGEVKAPSLGVTDELLSKYPQSLSASTGKTPKSGVDVMDDSGKALPLMTILKGSAFPDVEKKLDFYSQETGIPRARWGTMAGNIVYADPKTNQYFRAEPSVVNASDVIDAWQRATKWMASQVGPTVPGVAGGVVGAAMGPTPASIPAAGATAAGVDLVRQGIGNMMLEGDQTAPWADPNALLNAGGQGLAAAAGQGLAVGINKAITSNPLKVSPYDRARATDPATLAAARQAKREASDQGVDLTFGQSTNLRSGLSSERQLARDPASMDTMDQFYQKQRGQIGEAATKYIDDLSPVQSVDEGVNAMRGGAEATINSAKTARSAAAKPEYDKVMGLAIPDEELAALKSDAVIARALRYVRGNTAYQREITGLPDSSMKVLDLAKRRIDDQIGVAQRAGNNNEARLLTGAKSDLVAKLDSLIPDYKPAREAFAGMSPAIDEMQSGIVGSLANKEGVERISEIRNLFNANLSNPAAVGKARAAFESAGKGDQWNAGLATYLRDALDAASKTDKGLSAQRLVTSVYGDSRQKALIKEAMTPQQFDGFTRLMNVIQHVARSLPEGSPTATDTIGGQALRDQFGKPLKVAKDAVNMKFGDALFDWKTRKMSDAGMEKLAKAVTDPNSIEQLKKLRMLDPRSEKALVAASQLLGITAVGSSGLRDPADRVPEAMKQDRQQP